MKKMLLIFSHELTDLQKKDATLYLGIEHFLSLPCDLQKNWSDVSPKGELPKKELQKIIDWIVGNSSKGDYLLVEGDFGATYYIVNYCLKNSLLPVYSTTNRIHDFEYRADGSVKNEHIFKHINFREYKDYI